MLSGKHLQVALVELLLIAAVVGCERLCDGMVHDD